MLPDTNILHERDTFPSINILDIYILPDIGIFPSIKILSEKDILTNVNIFFDHIGPSFVV